MKEPVWLTDEQIELIAGRAAQKALNDAKVDDIAEKAAQKALAKVYADVGRSVVTKILWLVGIAFVGLAIWITNGEAIKP